MSISGIPHPSELLGDDGLPTIDALLAMKPQERKLVKVDLDSDAVQGMRTFARLAKISYSSMLQDELNNQFHHNEALHLLQKFTNSDVVTIRDNANRALYIIYRGTDISNATGNRTRDIIDDIGILMNNVGYVSRLKGLEELTIAAIRDNADVHSVYLIGHSLGGFVGLQIVNDSSLHAMFPRIPIYGRFFNLGSSPVNKGLDQAHANDNVIHYTTNNPKKGIIDPISISSVARDHYKVYIVPPMAGESAHSLNNFL